MRNDAGKEIKIPLVRLSTKDQRLVEEQSANLVVNGTANIELPTSFEELSDVIEELRYAKDVVSLVKQFILNETTSQSDGKQAKDSLGKWNELTTAGGVKYGGEWRTHNEIQQLQEEANELLGSAAKLISVGNLSIAQSNLRKARAADPENYLADFNLDLLHALVIQPSDAARARKYFVAAIRRLQAIGRYRSFVQEVNLIAVMNNAAIAEVRMGSFGSALRRWRAAVEKENPTPEIIQNLGRYSEISVRHPFLKISRGTSKSVAELYGSVATRFAKRPYDQKTGWLYVMPIQERIEKGDKPADKGNDPTEVPTSPKWAEELRLIGHGTGFVVADGIVLTNKHVAEAAISFGFKVDKDALEGINGHCLKLSPDWDLALIKVPNLTLPPLKWASEKPRRGTELRVLGYPMSSPLLGESLKVTSGTFAGTSQNNHYLYDAVLNQGNSGGPAINIHGEVLAINTFYTLTDMKYAGGVPFDAACAFLKENKIPVVANQSQQVMEKDEDWLDVIEIAGKSTVQILCYATPGKANWVAKNKSENPSNKKKRVIPKDWNGLEDRWCMYCDGLAHVECQNRKCKSGVIVGRESQIIKLPDGEARRYVTTRDKCPTCSGRGRVSCPYCNNGLDPSL